MYFLLPLRVPATWHSLAQTSTRTEFQSHAHLVGVHDSTAQSYCQYGCSFIAYCGARGESAWQIYKMDVNMNYAILIDNMIYKNVSPLLFRGFRVQNLYTFV